MDFKATDAVNKAIQAAQEMASTKGCVSIEPAHVAFAVFADQKGLGAAALAKAGGTLNQFAHPSHHTHAFPHLLIRHMHSLSCGPAHTFSHGLSFNLPLNFWPS